MELITETLRTAVMTELDFQRASRFVQEELGIMMPATKRTMLESRLQKRLRILRIGSFEEYFNYVFSPPGMENELVHMIDLVTTNKTEFFREPAHFDYLQNTAVPELMRMHGCGTKRRLMVWSAGCSTGEEPYTMAMVLRDFADRCRIPDFEYLILATDISTRVLHYAENAIYTGEKIAPVPMEMRKRYLLRSRDRQSDLVRIGSRIREAVRFRRLNFMDEDFGFREKLDIIFCRNVVIYFDRRTQQKLFNKFYECMVPGGYFFTGHSETMNGLDVPFVRVDTAVYRKPR